MFQDIVLVPTLRTLSFGTSRYLDHTLRPWLTKLSSLVPPIALSTSLFGRSPPSPKCCFFSWLGCPGLSRALKRPTVQYFSIVQPPCRRRPQGLKSAVTLIT